MARKFLAWQLAAHPVAVKETTSTMMQKRGLRQLDAAEQTWTEVSTGILRRGGAASIFYQRLLKELSCAGGAGHNLRRTMIAPRIIRGARAGGRT